MEKFAADPTASMPTACDDWGAGAPVDCNEKSHGEDTASPMM